MAQVRSPQYPTPEHQKHCTQLHHDIPIAICAGYNKLKGKCFKKATTKITKYFMPMCSTHSDQFIAASRCRALLSCGTECSRTCEWMPMGSQRCAAHLNVRSPCYFLRQLPLELRIRIYEYLLPAKEISIQKHHLRASTDGWISPYRPWATKKVHLDIFLANRQIYNECTRLLYGSSVFTIALEQGHVSMCNTDATLCGANDLPKNKELGASQDYQMQLMLLEQQNRRSISLAHSAYPRARLRRARISSALELDAVSTSTTPRVNNSVLDEKDFSTSLPSALSNSMASSSEAKTKVWPNDQLKARGTEMYRPVPQGAIWIPPLVKHCFNLISSFRITISLRTVNFSPRHGRRTPQSPQTDLPASPEKIYLYIDQLHRIVSRLQASQKSINWLEIKVLFADSRDPAKDVEVLSVLLRPFQRLAGVQLAVVLCCNESNAIVETVEIKSFIEGLKRDLQAPRPALIPGKMWDSYWGLERLMVKIAGDCQGTFVKSNRERQTEWMQKLSGFETLRHQARVAREEHKEEELKAVAAEVAATWWEYVEWEKIERERKEEERIKMREEVGADIFGMWRSLGAYDEEGNGEGDQLMS